MASTTKSRKPVRKASGFNAFTREYLQKGICKYNLKHCYFDDNYRNIQMHFDQLWNILV